MSLVTVDFDGPLYSGNSLMAMFETSKKELSLKQWFLILGNFLRMSRNKKIRREGFPVVFLRAFFYQMKGKSENEWKTFFQSVIEDGKHGINEEMVLEISKHLEKGDRVVILSGALQPFLEMFVQHLNIRAVRTAVILDGKGLSTGEIGKLNHGETKVENLKWWIEKNHVEEECIWAYADSKSDVPLLEFVDKAIVVNPSKAMKKLAQSKGWKLFDETKKCTSN